MYNLHLNLELNLNLDLEKARDQRSNCQSTLDHRKSKEFQKSIYFCFIDYTKDFDSVDHNKLENYEIDRNTRKTSTSASQTMLKLWLCEL